MGIIQKIETWTLGTILAASIVSTAHAEPKPFGKIAGYYDTRGMPTATVTVGASDLPLGIKFFGFLDLATEKENPDNLTPPYGEFRLTKKSDIGLGAAVEYNRDFSKDHGITRTGLVYEPNLSEILPNTFLGMKFYPVSTHDSGIQLGIYGGTKFLNGDLQLNGVFDYNFKPNKAFSEVQVGYRLIDDLFAVVEGRYNGFLEDQLGVGIGLEWKL